MAEPQREVPLRLFRDSGPIVDCYFLRDDGFGHSLPYDLTDVALAFVRKARAVDDDPAPLYSTANGGIQVKDAPAGRAWISVAAADIAHGGQYRYLVKATHQSGQVDILAWGPLSIVDR